MLTHIMIDRFEPSKSDPNNVINFSARKAQKDSSAVNPQSRGKSPVGETSIVSLSNKRSDSATIVNIPTLKDMYDNSVITLGGETIENLFRQATESCPKELLEKYLYAVELQLFRGRLFLIKDNISDRRQRKLPYRELINYTLGRAEEFEDSQTEDYRQKLRDEVIRISRNIFGDHETGKILERHQLLIDATKANNPTPNPSPFKVIK